MEHEAYRPGAQVLGDWNIVSCLGEGSYGKVFEIERSEFGQTYRAALKVITVPQSSAEVRSVISEGMSVSQAEAYFHGIVEELMHEFSIMFKLKGTANVVSCEDLRVLEHPDGIGWDILIRMELLHPLLPYVYEHPMARRDIIRLGIDICKALELCQRYNIIHRDIKPENIFISDNRDYKLGDFGIARTIERTTSGLSKKGTYSYMAPEVYAGREYGFSVDTYSLGLVLYRMLNKNRGPFLPQPPEAITFSSREQALGRRISGEALPRPFYGEGRLGEIVLKACAFDPKDRYSSPQQLRQELEAILYTQTDAAVIYPDGDELTMDRESYASARYAAAFGTSTSKSASATQGVFTGDYHIKAEATSEERTQSAFGSEEPKGAGTKKKRKRRCGLRIAAGIAGGAAALVVLAVAVTALLHWRGAPIPAFLDRPIAAVLGKYAVPKALWEYEEAGTLERNYEKGMMTGYKIRIENIEKEGWPGTFTEEHFFDLSGNLVEIKCYDEENDALWYIEEYDVSGYLKRYEMYNRDRDSNLIMGVKEYDSDGNTVREEYYDENGILSFVEIHNGEESWTEHYDETGNLYDAIERKYENGNFIGYNWYQYDENGELTEVCYYDADKNMTKQEYYENGMLQSYWNQDDAGNWVGYNADGTPYDYDNEVTAQTDSGVANENREDYYDENGELRQYALSQYDAEGNVIEVCRYDKTDALVWYSVYSYDSKGNLSECTVYDKFDNILLNLTYAYDSSGNLIEQISETTVDGALAHYLYYQCEYDDAGNIVKEEEGDLEGAFARNLCTYDGTGNMTKLECYLKIEREWRLARYNVYSFDAAGNRVQKEYYEDGKLIRYTVNEFDQQGNTVTSKVYNADGTLNTNSLYKYNGDYYTVEYQYGQNNELLAYRIYEYDAIGNIAWEGTYNQNNELIDYFLYEFHTVADPTKYVYNPEDGSLNLDSFVTGADGDKAYLIRQAR